LSGTPPLKEKEEGGTPVDRGFDRCLHSTAGGFTFPDSPRTELFLNGENVGRRGCPGDTGVVRSFCGAGGGGGQ